MSASSDHCIGMGVTLIDMKGLWDVNTLEALVPFEDGKVKAGEFTISYLSTLCMNLLSCSVEILVTNQFDF